MRLPRDVPTPAGRTFIETGPEIATAILRTVEAGWTHASATADVHAGAGEVALTERLRDGMRTALTSGALPWNRTLVVLPGTESRSRPEVLRPDGRTDIPILWIEIFLRFGEHDPHAIIECKRIAGADTHLCRQYVVEGIDRFRTGKYAANHATGFMVGYLIAGDAAAAAQGINRYLNLPREQQAPRQNENLAPSILVEEPWAWASHHPRTGASRIELQHSFLHSRGGNGVGSRAESRASTGSRDRRG